MNGTMNSIDRKLWYKDFLANGDILEMIIPKKMMTLQFLARQMENRLKLSKIKTEILKSGGQFTPMRT